MRDDYKFNGPTAKFNVEVEKQLIETIQAMSEHTQLSVAEITNTALKRFISGHKDFLPPALREKKAG
jgi:hypothetical protein